MRLACTGLVLGTAESRQEPILFPSGTEGLQTLCWRRQSGANPSLKWDFRNNARYRGVRRLFLVVSAGIFLNRVASRLLGLVLRHCES